MKILKDDKEPILLTDEWLLKFGFRNNAGFFTLGLLSCVESYDDQCYYFYYGKDGDNEIKIRYVHQLKNLYFALTQKELEVA